MYVDNGCLIRYQLFQALGGLLLHSDTRWLSGPKQNAL